MSFCQIAQKVGKTFMTLNNLELRHNARGISNSKPLEHLEPIQCGRYRAWKLGSDTLKTIHTPRHVDIKSVILHEKLSVCKMIWATKLKMFENIYQQWLLSGLWIAGLWIRKKTRHISANILSDHSFGMWCPNTMLASDMENNAILATAISGYTGCLKTEFYRIGHFQICHKCHKYLFPFGSRISKSSIW